MISSIEALRAKIEKDYVGFSPSTTAVKPAHIANGMFRTILNESHPVKLLNRVAFSEDAKGRVPRGNDLKAVYSALSFNDKIDPAGVSEDSLSKLRRVLRSVVTADSAAFSGGMGTYSTGFHAFLTKDTIAQDGGELIAHCLQQGNSELVPYLSRVLLDPSDVVTLISGPLIEIESGQKPSPSHTDPNIKFLPRDELVSQTDRWWFSVIEASNTLARHLEGHPNKLFGQRLSVLFASFLLIRHLATLEAYYCPGRQESTPAFLLDFSTNNNDPVAKASLQTYTRASQSIVRFYGWAFGEQLKDIPLSQLAQEAPPTYKGKTANFGSEKDKTQATEAKEIWHMAAQRYHEDAANGYTVFGEAVYDMLATQATADPVKYMRKLGLLSGMLYPPRQSTHRFLVKQDVLEMLVRGAVAPGETIDMPSLQERFWDRYRLIIGGRLQDEYELNRMGIYQVDRNALADNRRRFANALRQLDFAQMLADGVLRVEL